MKTKCVLLFLLSVCSISMSVAQEEPAPPALKNDIGFNTIFIFNGILNSYQTPFSVMYKRYSKANQAFRIGVSTNLDLNKLDPSSTFDSTVTYSTSASYNFSIALGKEFQKTIGTRWIWYYGVDVIPGYSLYENTSNVSAGKQKYNTSTRKTFSVSGRPFLGIRFNINQRLYLSAEANLSFNYLKNSNTEKYFLNDRQNSNIKSSNLSLRLTPASGLFLYYRF